VVESADAGIACASFTHARRHPMVLGRVAGWAPPFQLSVTQLAVLVGSFLTLTSSRPAWSVAVPPGLSTVVLLGLPAGLAWAIRRVRVEGRSLPRAALGWLTLWSQPAGGVVGGRPVRDARTSSSRGRAFVARSGG
jgi:hypothetical protein